MKALAKRLEDRYQSAGGDAQRHRALPRRPARCTRWCRPRRRPRSSRPRTRPPTATAVRAAVPPEEPTSDRGPRTGLLVLLGLLLLALVAAAAFLLPKTVRQPPDQVRVPSVIGLSEKKARDRDRRRRPQPSGTYSSDDETSRRPGHRARTPTPRTPTSTPDTVGGPRGLHRQADGRACRRWSGSTAPGRHHAPRRPACEAQFPMKDSDEPRGQVLAHRPRRRAERARGHHRSTVYCSDGPEEGARRGRHDQKAAEQAIRDAGFTARRGQDLRHRAEGHGDPAEPRRAAPGQPGHDGDDLSSRASSEPTEPTPSPTERPPSRRPSRRPTPRRCRPARRARPAGARRRAWAH